MKRILLVILVAACGTVLSAQTRPAAQAKPAPAAPAPSKPAAPTMPLIDSREMGGQLVNIRLDVTVLDQISDGPSVPKTITAVLCDRAYTRTRSPFADRQIGIDARPVLMDGKIRLELSISSNRADGNNDPAQRQLNWSNQFALLLDSGKALTVFEASDEGSKRKTTVEVKATILK